METGVNNHIKDYLEYYIGLIDAPEFAVLLRGKWGSGKSWFIKKYIKEKGTEQFLYVSLYGLSSYSEIEDAFFEQLHPFLASKGMKIAGKILKGIVKTTVKIDFDNNHKQELNLTGGLPSLEIPDYLKRLDGKTIVFDDLERCSLPIHQVMGYINQYVETRGLKVILLANEDEIIKLDSEEKKPENATRYLTIKEKLIGKSFDVASDPTSALQDFIDSLSNESCRKYLTDNFWISMLVFNAAGYKNLRHLKQSLFDYKRLYILFDDEILQCRPLMTHLTNLFFILSIELKNGTIHENNLSDIFSLTNLIRKDVDNKSIANDIKAKYPLLTKHAFHPLSPETWTELFSTGKVDREELNNELIQTNYLSKEIEPSWKKLMFFENLEDTNFLKLYNEVYEDFTRNKIANPISLFRLLEY